MDTETLRRGMILTAGPSITTREIEHVMEAVTYGWNSRHSEFIRTFQEAFAAYIGTKYAMCTSSCTGALHLSLAGLGIKPGDEILVPEITWVASGFAPTYVGAKPVFVDIEPDTWCMSPESIVRHITPKTRAIMPVHLYGHPCDMDAIMEIARQYKLFVIEDAAPSAGSSWNGRKTGSFGDASAFSFQGAKIMVSGEGGMFCTNDVDLYKKAQYLNDYAVDSNKSFWVEEIGYKFRMSNIQAALGLAQLKRLDELVERKRTIFGWYQERLGNTAGIALSAERPQARNNYWMPSLVLNDAIKMEVGEFRAKLKELMVDTRPFFYPMSSLPMFSSQEADNPVAFGLWRRGVNLPSGHNLAEDDIDYICQSIHRVLGHDSRSRAKPQFTGPIARLIQEKNRSASDALQVPFMGADNQQASLQMMTYGHLADPATMQRIQQWRTGPADNFVTASTLLRDCGPNWLEKDILDVKDRALFWVMDHRGQKIGHLGISTFSLSMQRYEIDNIACEQSTAAVTLMTNAIDALVTWVREELHANECYIRVLHDDQAGMRAIQSLNFSEIQRVPLKLVDVGNGAQWRELVVDPYTPVRHYLVTFGPRSSKA